MGVFTLTGLSDYITSFIYNYNRGKCIYQGADQLCRLLATVQSSRVSPSGEFVTVEAQGSGVAEYYGARFVERFVGRMVGVNPRKVITYAKLAKATKTTACTYYRVSLTNRVL